MTGDSASLAPPEAAMANASKQAPNTPYGVTSQNFNIAEPSPSDAGATANADPSMVKMQNSPNVPSIRPIISEAPPSSHQYATANAQIVPIGTLNGANNEGVADTGDDVEKPTVQCLEW